MSLLKMTLAAAVWMAAPVAASAIESATDRDVQQMIGERGAAAPAVKSEEPVAGATGYRGGETVEEIDVITCAMCTPGARLVVTDTPSGVVMTWTSDDPETLAALKTKAYALEAIQATRASEADDRE